MFVSAHFPVCAQSWGQMGGVFLCRGLRIEMMGSLTASVESHL